MKYRDFGRSGITVSSIGLGSHMFPLRDPRWDGYHGKGVREDVAYEERKTVVRRAFDLGITLYDCDMGFEKEIMGRIVQDMGVRHEMVLASWVDYRPESNEAVDWARFARAFENLLKTLKTDYLDILNWRLSPALVDSPFLEEFRAQTERLKASGALRASSFYTGDGSDSLICRAARRGCSDGIFRGFGFLNPDVRRNVLQLTEEAELGFLGFVPFQKGWFFRCAKEAGLTADGGREIAVAGIKWVLAHAQVSSLLIGVSTVEELEVDCHAVDEPPALTWEQTDMLQALTKTSAYGEFISLMNEQNPHIYFDWRQADVCEEVV